MRGVPAPLAVVLEGVEGRAIAFFRGVRRSSSSELSSSSPASERVSGWGFAVDVAFVVSDCTVFLVPALPLLLVLGLGLGLGEAWDCRGSCSSLRWGELGEASTSGSGDFTRLVRRGRLPSATSTICVCTGRLFIMVLALRRLHSLSLSCPVSEVPLGHPPPQ